MLNINITKNTDPQGNMLDADITIHQDDIIELGTIKISLSKWFELKNTVDKLIVS
jgi:hypothetical protein